MLSRVVEVMKQAAINATNTNSENFVQHMDLLVSYVDTKLHSFNEGSMVLNKEVQFNDWIFNYIHPVLVKTGFTVEADIVNKDIIPNVNEYSTSKPDCLIYHEGSICRQRISALNVQVMDMSRIDSLEANLQEDESIDYADLNQCFCNMFGSGTKPATMLLRMGKIMKVVTMYGIVVSMQDHTKVSTLKMTMDFLNSQCTYWRVRQQMSFMDSLNIVLSKLAN